YVSQEGDDNNPGTKDKPFRTFQKLNTIKLKPGYNIYLKGGETFTGTLTLKVEGTSQDPIVISSYDNLKGNAVIDGGNKQAIIITGRYFEIRHINVKGNGRKSGNITNGITVKESSFVLLQNIRISGFQKSGVELLSCRNVDVNNVYAFDNGFCGINVTGIKENRSRNITIKDCMAENNPGDPANLDNHSGNGILAGWSDSVTID